jgi:hypothetical protein
MRHVCGACERGRAGRHCTGFRPIAGRHSACTRSFGGMRVHFCSRRATRGSPRTSCHADAKAFTVLSSHDTSRISADSDGVGTGLASQREVLLCSIPHAKNLMIPRQRGLTEDVSRVSASEEVAGRLISWRCISALLAQAHSKGVPLVL